MQSDRVYQILTSCPTKMKFTDDNGQQYLIDHLRHLPFWSNINSHIWTINCSSATVVQTFFEELPNPVNENVVSSLELMKIYYTRSLEDFLIYKNYREVFDCSVETLQNKIDSLYESEINATPYKEQVLSMIKIVVVINLIYYIFPVMNLPGLEVRMYNNFSNCCSSPRLLDKLIKAAKSLSTSDIISYRNSVRKIRFMGMPATECAKVHQMLAYKICKMYHDYFKLIEASDLKTMLDLMIGLEPIISQSMRSPSRNKGLAGGTIYSTPNMMQKIDIYAVANLIAIITSKKSDTISFNMNIIRGHELTIVI